MVEGKQNGANNLVMVVELENVTTAHYSGGMCSAPWGMCSR